MLTFVNDGTTMFLFIFNHVIIDFIIPKDLVTNHGSHFQNRMMMKLANELGFHQ
jgi:hypothetical protein